MGGDFLTLDLGSGVKLELVRIKRGKFLMGEPNSESYPDEKPQHEVTISKDFYLGKYLVTQEQYELVMGANPSWFSAKGGGKDKVGELDTSRFPVEDVWHEDARKFCEKASERTKRKVQLPTEAQWEYACAAGTKTKYYSGDTLTERDANFGLNVGRSSEVGKYPANPWGLYDMTGNVCQWCADGKRTYRSDAQTDPEGPDDDKGRMLRGGSWSSDPRFCRRAYRSVGSYRSISSGFRVLVRLD